MILRMAALGWVRLDPRPRRKLQARWRHAEGWTLQHCGHPTALWPWVLYDPEGRMHCTGFPVSGRPSFGTAWPTLLGAALYVKEHGPSARKAMDDEEMMMRKKADPGSVVPVAPKDGVYILNSSVPNPAADGRRREWVYAQLFPQGRYLVRQLGKADMDGQERVLIEYLTGKRYDYIESSLIDGRLKGQAAALYAALEPDPSLEGWLMALKRLEYLDYLDLLSEVGKSQAGEALVRTAAEQLLHRMKEGVTRAGTVTLTPSDGLRAEEGAHGNQD